MQAFFKISYLLIYYRDFAIAPSESGRQRKMQCLPDAIIKQNPTIFPAWFVQIICEIPVNVL